MSLSADGNVMDVSGNCLLDVDLLASVSSSDDVIASGSEPNTSPISCSLSPLPDTKKSNRPAKSKSSGSGRGVIQCAICSKTFNNSSALAKHKLIHSDERKYMCTQCSKSFKRQDHLNGHLMTHSSKKPYECKVVGCEKSYCDARSLRRHHENHHQQLLESCSSATSDGILTPRSAVDASNQTTVFSFEFVGNASSGVENSLTAAGIVTPTSTSPGAGVSPNNPGGPLSAGLTWTGGISPFDEPLLVQCTMCERRFRNLAALNGHMRLHGGYVRKEDSETPTTTSATCIHEDISSKDTLSVEPTSSFREIHTNCRSESAADNLHGLVSGPQNNRTFQDEMATSETQLDGRSQMLVDDTNWSLTDLDCEQCEDGHNLLLSPTSTTSDMLADNANSYLQSNVKPTNVYNVLANSCNNSEVQYAPSSILSARDESGQSSSPANSQLVDSDCKTQCSLSNEVCIPSGFLQVGNIMVINQSLPESPHVAAHSAVQSAAQLHVTYPAVCTTSLVHPAVCTTSLMLADKFPSSPALANLVTQSSTPSSQPMTLTQYFQLSSPLLLNPTGHLVTMTAADPRTPVFPTTLSQQQAKFQPFSPGTPFTPSTPSIFQFPPTIVCADGTTLHQQKHRSYHPYNSPSTVLTSPHYMRQQQQQQLRQQEQFERDKAEAHKEIQQRLEQLQQADMWKKQQQVNIVMDRVPSLPTSANSSLSIDTSGSVAASSLMDTGQELPSPIDEVIQILVAEHLGMSVADQAVGGDVKDGACAETVRSDGSPTQSSCMPEFHNPAANTVRRKHKPEPLVIPASVSNFGFPSQLRSPKLWESGSRGSRTADGQTTTTPYTPPPMISPARSGSGVYWTIQQACTLPQSAPHYRSTLLSFGSFDNKLPPETDIQPHVNIGPQFQADVPSCNVGDIPETEKDATLMWDPKLVENLSDEELKNYQNFACCANIPGNGTNREYALHLLQMCNGHIKAAQLKLMQGGSKDLNQYVEWSAGEMEIFSRSLIATNKDFSLVAKQVGTKNVKQCVHFYYLWKKVCSDEYQALCTVRHQLRHSLSRFTDDMITNSSRQGVTS